MKSYFATFFIISLVCMIGLSLTVYASDSNIPEWIKNTAKWWSEGSISDTDYVQSLEYMINNGIIDVPIPITEVTATQTMYSDKERAQSFRVTISNIIEPLPVHFFEKFELTTSDPGNADDPRGRMYNFRDTAPTFFLESVPSADKKQFYDFIGDWMDRGDLLNEFDVDIAVLDGTGTVIQTWAFKNCGITSYGTYLQDTVFIYQFSGGQDSEIRDRTNFSCVGISLETP
ncbi:MAG: hypothetical protein K5777_08840 [Nitrosopumilus sp.]|nr:hypothetical protein [Nitrosopumilus sp.]